MNEYNTLIPFEDQIKTGLIRIKQQYLQLIKNFNNINKRLQLIENIQHNQDILINFTNNAALKLFFQDLNLRLSIASSLNNLEAIIIAKKMYFEIANTILKF